ncbi:O-antigen ligase family protein [Aeromonas veronii]|uniref:O-antigen ligase family protein n=1 Tax=Aeromonas veronii TaxID=654 RepID=UPI0033056347
MTDSIKRYLESERCSSLMFLSIICYVMFKDSFQVVGDFFQTVMIIGGLAAIAVYRDFFAKNVVFWLLVIGGVIQFVSWFMSTITIPELAQPTPNLKPFSYLMVFLVMAFWLKGSFKRSIVTLLAFSVGSVFTLFYYSDFFEQFINGMHGSRVDFGYRNAQHGSLIIGAAFICILWGIYDIAPQEKNNKGFIISGLCLFLVFLGALLMMFQSRQSWLAVFMAIFVIPLLYAYFRDSVSLRKIIMLYGVIFVIGALIYHVDFVHDRIYAGFSHPGDLHNMLSGNWREVKDISIGVRLQTWLEAINWFYSHPIFGTGDGSRSLVITQSVILPDYIKAEFRHLHNSNFETAVSYGAVGFIFTYVLMFYPVYKSVRSNAPTLIKCIAISFLIYWLTINNFESFLYMRSGQWVFNTFFGVIYTFSLHSDFVEYQHSKKNIGGDI